MGVLEAGFPKSPGEKSGGRAETPRIVGWVGERGPPRSPGVVCGAEPPEDHGGREGSAALAVGR